ncbi:TerD family protein, partial [Frankia sp. EI5c]|uniref:TerD family protein n=1 Tax=Frankia sp. EI5c TaxID=683316 RepID=UPI0026F41C70
MRLELDQRGGPEVDVCAVLVTSTGKVRSDADLVFFNQPVHPSGAVRVNTGLFTASLPAVEPEVEVIVLAGSVDTGTFLDLSELRVNVIAEPGGPLAGFVPSLTEPVTTMVFGELYRRGGGWKFRAVGQGWSSGLAGLATSYGIKVDDEPDPAPDPRSTGPAPVPAGPAPVPVPVPAGPASGPAAPPPPPRPAPPPPVGARADWLPDSTDPSSLRWWDGSAWSEHRVPAWRETESTCGGCGRTKRRRLGLGTARCADCDARIHRALTQWQRQLVDVLAHEGASRPALDQLWTDLRFQRIPEAWAHDLYRKAGLAHLERVVTFAFADGIIEQEELTGFLAAVEVLNIQDSTIDRMRARLERGRALAAFLEGDLPRVQNPSLHLEAGEILHLDV